MNLAALDLLTAPEVGAATGERPRTARASSDIRLTSRGIGSLVAGIVVAVLGVGFATPVLVYIGVATTCAVAVAWAWALLAARSLNRIHPQVHREVLPLPLTAGMPGRVSVSVSASGRGGLARLLRAATEHTDLREQAAAELTGGMGTKAKVERGNGMFTLRYDVYPTQRGRWPLGPALIHSSDPFGMLLTDISVGQTQHVPVWPATIDLSGPAGALLGHADRVVLGARTPSSDDVALRDYREGDDLRRVHWPSSARRGTMLVRSDEQTGRRPATVILDPPLEPQALEIAISAAASVALSVLESGHPVRLVGAGLDADSIRHFGERGREAGRYDLLNQTVDLSSPQSREAGAADLVRTARLVAEDSRHGEVTIAILEPLTGDELNALVPLGEFGRAWAIVRSDPWVEKGARRTVSRLRRAGWQAATMQADDDLTEVWERMLRAGDLG